MMQSCLSQVGVQLSHLVDSYHHSPTNADNFAAGASEDSQNLNQTTVFNGKSTGTDQPRNTGMQMSPSKPAPAGITGSMQTSPKKVSQTGGTQTTPPSSPKRSTLTGETQTTPP